MVPVIASLRNVRTAWHPRAVLPWLGAAVFAAIVFGPILALFSATAGALTSGHGHWAALALPTGRTFTLLVRSTGLALSVAAGGMALGVLLATVFSRWRVGPKAYLRWLVLALAPVPAYVHALAWSTTVFAANRWLERLGLPALQLEGLLGSWWVQLMALLPIALGIALVALESVPPELTEAARLARPDAHVLARVILPLSAPMIAAGAGILFLLSLLDYSVPALFQVNVYALAIFTEYSASGQAVRAFLLALPLLVVTMFVVVASQTGLRHAARRATRRTGVSFAPPVWPAWLVWLQGLAIAALLGHLLVPLISLTTAVGSWRVFAQTAASAGSEIAFSLWVSLLTALVTLPLALAAVQPLLRQDRLGRWWWLLITAPLAIPAPLVGIGLIAIWNRPGLPPVYGSATMPVMAALARFAPLAAIVVLIQLRQIDRELIDAARVYQTGAARAWLQVRLPMLAPGLLAGASIAFALSLGELGATLVIAPPGRATLSMRVFNYLHYGASDAVAGLCLIMAVASIAAGLLAIGSLLAWSRLLPSAGAGAVPR